jgi:hypothetical protein
LRAGLPKVAIGFAGGSLVVAAAVATVLSCLPDLPADAPLPPPAAPTGCGDGIIDFEAGEECDPGPEYAAGSVCSSNCKVICAGLKWPLNDHCYELEPAAKSLTTTAEQVCNTHGGSHVVTFASESELAATVEYVRNNSLAASDFWVGLDVASYRFYSSVAPDEPGWSPQCPGCYAHTNDPNAPLHLPKGVEAGAGCVIGTLLANGTTVPQWDQHPCDGALVHVLCEREPVGTHLRPCIDAGVACMELVFTAGEKRYVYVSQELPADEAQAYCASLGDGGTLVVFESRDEREQLWHELAPLSPGAIWIGLATDDAGVWTWDDGTRSDAGYPSAWGVGQPAADAGRALMQTDPYAVDNTLAISTTALGDSRPFVCQLRTKVR